MRASTVLALILGGILASGARPAAGVDQPISGKRIVVQVGAVEKLVFVSKDPAFLFPAPGSPDDPGLGSPGGALVEVFSPDEPPAALAMPPGAGVPGWTTRTGAIPMHRWRNPGAPAGPSPVKVARLKQGKVLSVVARDAGLALLAPPTRVAIRVTTGSLRSCAVFEGASIRTNTAGRFVARNAPAPALGDCSDASLLGLPACADASYPTCGGGCAAGGTCAPDGFSSVCHCVSPSMPCGETNPTCNGACPAGETCASSGYGSPLNSCGCIPVGSTPCGTPGPPACGGACPSGTTCGGLFPLPGMSGPIVCGCNAPGMSCANGFAFGGAPAEGMPFMCYPILCSGTYPTCGGGCLDAGLCSAFTIDGLGFTQCICAAPLPCGAGGFDCPAGNVCHLPLGGTPSCGPP